MNERIQKLIEEAVAKSLLEFSESNITVTIEGSIGGIVATIPTEFCEKFAELIVRECGVALSPMLRDMVSRGQAFDLIKQHFGVK